MSEAATNAAAGGQEREDELPVIGWIARVGETADLANGTARDVVFVEEDRNCDEDPCTFIRDLYADQSCSREVGSLKQLLTFFSNNRMIRNEQKFKKLDDVDLEDGASLAIFELKCGNIRLCGFQSRRKDKEVFVVTWVFRKKSDRISKSDLKNVKNNSRRVHARWNALQQQKAMP